MNARVVVPTQRRPQSLSITLQDNEPRVLDTALGAQLGMTKPEDVRRTIQAHREELEAFGVIASRAITSGAKGGRPGTAYYLNRQQALLICILSKTEKAKEVRAEVIRVFTAFESLTMPAPAPVESAFQIPQTLGEALRLAADLSDENTALKVENKTMSRVINFLSVQTFMALKGLYEPYRGFNSKLGIQAKKISITKGLEMGWEPRVVTPYKGIKVGQQIESEVRAYEREALEEAYLLVRPL